ncbi:arylsulfatase [Echinicola sp. CAU 1574]|uniref:Arylsulfatase n=1 Tax=Echinicola arenosa TaxID=2774144 RepID=A0ABR9AIT2_9BACT|nr:arylsulfatase [Echinicola arenosa]MBD8488745.1 arylsulfatase [Echinicola arenosa]
MAKKSLILIFAVKIIVLFLVGFNNLPEKAKQPNIILIYADDFGKGLLSHEGQKYIRTPHIDQLAKQGIKFTNATGSMLCAPARAALISGLHDCHEVGFEVSRGQLYKNISTGKYAHEEIENMINQGLSPIPSDQIFLGQIAQKAGYKTAQFGKLEWGFSASHHQMERHGWDHYLGYLDHNRAHGFYPPFLFENGQMIQIPGNTRMDCGKSIEMETPAAYQERWDMTGKETYSQNLFMENVLAFIRSNKENPFFLYFPTQLPHGPVAIPKVHPEIAKIDELTQIEKEYASMVKLLDDNVGQIMAELENQGIAENTMVIFTSDNGHEIYYTQQNRVLKPYTNMETGKRFDNLDHKYYSELAGDIFNGNDGRAGMKRSNLQGGLEVPLIVKWPGKIKPGSSSDLLVTNYDFLPTLAEIVGFEEKFTTDGVSFLPALLGKDQQKKHEYIVHSSFEGPTLITQEGWKIRYFIQKDTFELFYLPDDYKETHDLSEQYPEKLVHLKSKLLSACDGDFKNGWFRSSNEINVEKSSNL